MALRKLTELLDSRRESFAYGDTFDTDLYQDTVCCLPLPFLFRPGLLWRVAGAAMQSNADGQDLFELKRPRDFVGNNSFALPFVQRLQESGLLPQATAFSPLCQECSNDKILSPYFKRLCSLSELRKNAKLCALCNILQRFIKPFAKSDRDTVTVSRDRSNLVCDGRKHWPALRVCAWPELSDASSDIPLGFPTLPKASGPVHVELLRAWLRACDEAHDCQPIADGPLPTRVLDVGHDAGSMPIRLHCTGRGQVGKYIALSHCWGRINESEKAKFCTYLCNIDHRRDSIDLAQLPKTFQDAVTVTRALGVRFLWIDSMCIIQPHTACVSQECAGAKDWSAESLKMEKYFSSAYCTIAAISARDSTGGLLNPRQSMGCLRLPTASGTIYICNDIDDFHCDVERGALSQRGWVFQERALSRRTIHFTNNQTYWECGWGIRCESLRAKERDFLADPQFPKSILSHAHASRIYLFQSIYKQYSRLALTNSADRSIAISGLEKRLANALDTTGNYGTFQCYLHRSLLWQRSDNCSTMKRISYPKGREMPSWSWMAYKGEIEYLKLPHVLKLSKTVRWTRSWKGVGVQLRALARTFSLNADEEQLLRLDEECNWDLRSLRCVIIGRITDGRFPDDCNDPGQGHYVLVVRPVDLRKSVYERVGVGLIKRKHISFRRSEAQNAKIV